MVDSVSAVVNLKLNFYQLITSMVEALNIGKKSRRKFVTFQLGLFKIIFQKDTEYCVITAISRMDTTAIAHIKMKNKIETVDINLLEANGYNSNKMNEMKFEALIDTIKRYGQTHPIQVVQDKEGKYRIIGGEHRWRAMKLLKFTQVDILCRAFADDIDEKLASVEDNLHGNPIPIKEAMIVASATKKYKLSDLQKRMGQSEPELKDKLILAGESDKLEKLKESIELEHTVELDFVVDCEAKENAERFLKTIVESARKLGARVIKSDVKMSKTKEAVGLVTFNVSDLQKNVIDTAIKAIMSQENVSKARALEFCAAEYIASANIHTEAENKAKNSQKLSPQRLARFRKKR